MSLLCKVFGHKNTTGEIKRFNELYRCNRCNKQIIYPASDVLHTELKESAEAMEKVNRYVGGNLYTEEEIQKYRKAAELISKE